MTTIDVHLKIYHDCNDGILPCQRRWSFELPNHYITSGKTPTKTLDIGTWNLEAKVCGGLCSCVSLHTCRCLMSLMIAFIRASTASLF